MLDGETTKHIKVILLSSRNFSVICLIIHTASSDDSFYLKLNCSSRHGIVWLSSSDISLVNAFSVLFNIVIYITVILWIYLLSFLKHGIIMLEFHSLGMDCLFIMLVKSFRSSFISCFSISLLILQILPLCGYLILYNIPVVFPC